MKFHHFAFAGALAALVTLPASAQTTQTSPAKPRTSVPAANPAKTPPAVSPGTPPAASPGAGSRPATSLLDINSASAEDLDKLPGVGKARSEAIIKNRPYKGKDNLLSRKIIPSNVYNGIKDKIIAKQG
jgi:competence protein ComEA